MCGIAGAIGLPLETATAVVERMRRALAHRGPDDHGTEVLWAEGAQHPVVLTHNRLAIIDLSAGRARADVLRRPGARADLQRRGLQLSARSAPSSRRAGSSSGARPMPRSSSPRYRAWGPEAVQRFRGMFAFAVADAKAREVWLCRDRLGIKPLYVDPAGLRRTAVRERGPRAPGGGPRAGAAARLRGRPGELPLPGNGVRVRLHRRGRLAPSTGDELARRLERAPSSSGDATGRFRSGRRRRSGVTAGPRRWRSSARSSGGRSGFISSRTCRWASSSPAASTRARSPRWRARSTAAGFTRSRSASTSRSSTRRARRRSWRERSGRHTRSCG